jgi:hypothetical protein
MNRDRTLLDLELRLLIVRHGRTQVSEALSAIGEVDLAMIDSRVRDHEKKVQKNRLQSGRRKSIGEMIREANPRNLDAERLIGKLARAYERKEFLPELRDVKKFLQSQRHQVAKLRSRATALPAVLSVLAACTDDELRELDEGRWIRGSDLGVITDQILGPVNGPGKRT